ncbi:MAG: CAP domain-containing protein [Candidatus Woesearchaeota archaeon]
MKKAILILFVLLLVGCSLYNEPVADQPDQLNNQLTGQVTQKYIKELDLQEIEKAVYQQINTVRKDAGVRALTFDGEMILIAQSHSNDMVENDYFSQINLEGKDATTRAVELGFNRKKWDGEWQDSVLVENIGKVSAEDFSEADQVAEALVDDWLEDEESMNNILISSLTHTGIGVAFDGENYLVTQNFW